MRPVETHSSLAHTLWECIPADLGMCPWIRCCWYSAYHSQVSTDLWVCQTRKNRSIPNTTAIHDCNFPKCPHQARPVSHPGTPGIHVAVLSPESMPDDPR